MHGTRNIKVIFSYTSRLFGNPETDFLHVSEKYLIWKYDSKIKSGTTLDSSLTVVSNTDHSVCRIWHTRHSNFHSAPLSMLL